MGRTTVFFLFTFCVTAMGQTINVEDLFNTTLVIDGNVNPLSKTPDQIGAPDFSRDINGDRAKVSTGIDVGSFTLAGESSASQFASYGSRFSDPSNPNYYTGARLVLDVDDIYAAWAGNEYATLIYNQVHPPIDNDESVLADWYNDGLRVMQLAYSDSTQTNRATNYAEDELLAGGGGGGSLDPIGLTDLGRRVVSNMVELGIIIDTSHGNERATLELVDYLELLGREDVPILANHTIALGLQRDSRWRRGTSDAELFAVAKTDGVVGVFTYGPWVYVENAGETSTAATVEDFVQHVDYMVNLLEAGDPNDGGTTYNGTDFVGLATDGYLDGTMANGNISGDGLLDAPDRFKHIIQALADTGRYNEQELRSIMGLNFLRVYTKVLGGSPFPAGEGVITKEAWNGVAGHLVSNMTDLAAFPDSPDHARLLTGFNSVETNSRPYGYGERIWGWLTAPVTGPYSFWISGSDHCELWLGSDRNAAGSQLIASVSGGTAYQDFDAEPSQRSAYIDLTKGERYFIEARHKDEDGEGHITAAWQGIHFNRRVIEGASLSPGIRDAYSFWNPWTEVEPGDPGTGRAEDYDGDGWSNEYEYHFGMNPEDAGNGNRPRALFVGDSPAVEYNVRRDNAHLLYYIDTSSDLENWLMDRRSTDFEAVFSSVNFSNGTERVTIRYGDSMPGNRFFIRIRAEENLP